MVTVALITLLAAILRFYRLPEVPPGLHFDEGFKGVTARAMLDGAPPRLFFESDMGEEPIAMYLVAAALAAVGDKPWVVRLPSAVVGTLTIPLAWWLGREMASCVGTARFRQPWLMKASSTPTVQSESRGNRDTTRFDSQIVGAGTALALAILYWHLSFSRIGMEPILVPFFATLAFGAMIRGLNTRQWPWFALAGLALGASLYTYKAGYFVPFVALLFVVAATLVERGFFRRNWQGMLVAALVALLVAAPIAFYFATHPANFLQRPASVALLAGEQQVESPAQALAANLPRVAGMFFVKGDANPRSNLPGRPALDPFLAILFAAGLGWAVVGSFRRHPLATLPLVWLGVMVVPTLITEHAPHFGRAIGATPALALLCALGGWWAWRAASGLGRRWISLAVALLLAVGLTFSGVQTVWAYFGTWARSPDLFYAYDEGLLQVADYIDTIPTSEAVYLTPTASEHFTLQFVIDRPFGSFDGRHGLVLPPAGQPATIVILVGEDEASLPALEQFQPDGKRLRTLVDGYGRPYAVAYHLPALEKPLTGALAPDSEVEATLGGAARLIGYSLESDTVAPGESLRLVLFWQALAPLDPDYTVFTHLLGEQNPATGTRLWAGHDAQPNAGHYPTTAWRQGEIILDVHEIILPPDAPPGEYQLEAGMYLLSTLVRLPASDAAGNSLPGDAVPLGKIRVED